MTMTRTKRGKYQTLADQGIIGLSVADVFRMRQELGRKFEAEDVDEYLYDAAYCYARDYKGDFEFMVDMAIAVHKHNYLSDAQAKAVLNCMAAEGRRFTGKPQAEAVRSAKFVGTHPDAALGPQNTRVVPNGRYTIVFNGDESDYVTLRVKDDFRDDAPAGSKVVQYLCSSDNETGYRGFGFVESGRVKVWSRFRDDSRLVKAAHVLVEDPEAAGMAYAMKEGRCRKCGRVLTVPTSISRGIGPECAKGGDM